MKGLVSIQIRRRVITPSWHFKDKWEHLDSVRLVSSGKGNFTTISKVTGQRFMISKDELAFARFIFGAYGWGDYSVLLFGKGKQRGFRRFWDGIISADGRFMRRKEEVQALTGKFPRKTLNTESFIGRYMKPKKPGIWYML